MLSLRGGRIRFGIDSTLSGLPGTVQSGRPGAFRLLRRVSARPRFACTHTAIMPLQLQAPVGATGVSTSCPSGDLQAAHADEVRLIGLDQLYADGT